MSRNQFARLAIPTRLVSVNTRYFEQVIEWQSKRENIELQLSDLPQLSELWKMTERTTNPDNPRTITYNRIPSLRLGNACEATANALYSLAEVAAAFANKATKGVIPSSFNALRKKVEKSPEWELKEVLGDLQWYKKIREIRTEFAHHSSIRIVGNFEDDPSIFIMPFRRQSDREEFTGHYTQIPMSDFMSWTRNAIETTDALAEYLADNYVIPSFNLEDKIWIPVNDINGMPIMHQNGSMESEEVTIGYHLRSKGVIK